MNSQPGSDRLYASLNPLVTNRTLTPAQANQVYAAVGAGGDGAAVSSAVPVVGWDRERLLAAVSVLGAGLLGTAYLLAAVIDDAQEFSWKTLVVLLAVTVVLGASSAASLLLLHGRVWAPWVSGVLGALALAALGLGPMILWDPEALVYLAGVAMMAGGVAGFWFLRGQLFAVVAVVGGGLLLGQIFSDTLDGGSGTGDVLTVGIAFLLYGLVVVAAGWRFSCRNLLGVVGLGIGISAMLVVVYVNALYFAFSVAVAADPLQGGIGGSDAAGVRADIRVAMILGLVVSVLAALAHAYTSYVGFAVVSFVGAGLVPVSALTALRGEHPMRWAAAFVVVGALAIAAALVVQLERTRSSPPPAYGGRPLPHEQRLDPGTDTIER